MRMRISVALFEKLVKADRLGERLIGTRLLNSVFHRSLFVRIFKDTDFNLVSCVIVFAKCTSKINCGSVYKAWVNKVKSIFALAP